MATLSETFSRRRDTDLRNRTAAACWNEAKGIFLEEVSTPNHADRLTWARAVLSDRGEGPEIRKVFRAAVVLLQDSATPTDAEVQSAVASVVNKFAVA